MLSLFADGSIYRQKCFLNPFSCFVFLSGLSSFRLLLGHRRRHKNFFFFWGRRKVFFKHKIELRVRLRIDFWAVSPEALNFYPFKKDSTTLLSVFSPCSPLLFSRAAICSDWWFWGEKETKKKNKIKQRKSH